MVSHFPSTNPQTVITSTVWTPYSLGKQNDDVTVGSRIHMPGSRSSMAATTLSLLGAMLAMTSRLVMGQLPGHGAWGGGYGTGWGISLGAPVPTGKLG